jgi:N-acyl-D-glutamate deacylase
VVKDSKVLRVKPGQQIRFPVEPKGKFKPIEVGGWLNKHTIGLNPDLAKIHLHDDTGAGSKLHKSE